MQYVGPIAETKTFKRPNALAIQSILVAKTIDCCGVWL